jgi:hypothetical protein
VSWIFSFLLVCYALVRISLRVRGQLRWRSIRDTLPPTPEPVEAPSHLGSRLGALYCESRELRITLVEARKVLIAVEATDPDAPLGKVRDARYRRSLMQAWTAIRTWVADNEQRPLAGADARQLEDFERDLQRVRDELEGLRGTWRSVSRSRALDPFPLDQMQAVADTFARLDHLLASLEARLDGLGADPYRDRFQTLALAKIRSGSPHSSPAPG